MTEKRDEFGEYLFDDKEHETEYIEESGYKESTIILIDCQPEMWEPCSLPDESLAGKTWLEACIAGAASMVRQRALEGAQDDVGVSFFNVGAPSALQEAESQGYAKVYRLQDLGPPTAARVKQLQGFDPGRLGQGSPAAADRTAALSNALWAASASLPGLGKLKGEAGIVAYGAQRVMVFTRDRDPTNGGCGGCGGGGGGGAAALALDKAKNIGIKGGTLELVPLVGPDEAFDLEPFWGPMLERQAAAGVASQTQSAAPAPGTPDAEEDDRVVSFRSLSAFVRARAFRKRALCRLMWGLGPGAPAIAVKLFSCVRPAARGQFSYVHALDNEPLVRATGLFDAETGADLGAARPRRFHPKPPKDTKGDGEAADPRAPRLPRVFATEEELREVKFPAPRGLELVGFKPRWALRPWHQLRSAAFLRPDEAAVSGSTAAFAALLDACAARGAVAVASMVRAPKAEPVLVALLPQAEARDAASGAQIAPPGFHVVALPFAEDVRWPERDAAFAGAGPAAPSPAALAAADALADAFRLQAFDSTALRDPAMQRFFEVLEAKALVEPLPEGEGEGADDDTLAQLGEDFPEGLADRLARVVCGEGGWEEGMLYGEKPKMEKASGQKRAAAAAGGEDGGQGWTDEELAGADLAAFKVPELKDLLRARGERLGGNKVDLIDRLQDYLASRGSGGG